MKRSLLELADEVRAIATTGLHFTEQEFDRDRYRKLLQIAAKMGALASEQSEEIIQALYLASDEGYVTPKLDVRMAIFEEDRVLLVQERSDECWALPGGYVDIGDTPATAAERETSEEACFEVRARKLAGVFDYRLQPLAPPLFFHVHKMVFVGDPLPNQPAPSAGPEVYAAEFFPISALPELSYARTLPIHIEIAHRCANDPTTPTHFD